MKNYLFLSFLLIQLINGQVGIGKETIGPSTILDFQENIKGGIALPKIGFTNQLGNEISSLNQNSVPGTIFFDLIDNKVKALVDINPDNGEFILQDLSIKEVPNSDFYYVSETRYDELNEIAQQGVVIGASITEVPGVLVLETTNAIKSLKLPTVQSYIEIKSPEPGMIAYDKSQKSLIVFNGHEWAFWTTN